MTLDEIFKTPGTVLGVTKVRRPSYSEGHYFRPTHIENKRYQGMTESGNPGAYDIFVKEFEIFVEKEIPKNQLVFETIRDALHNEPGLQDGTTALDMIQGASSILASMIVKFSKDQTPQERIKNCKSVLSDLEDNCVEVILKQGES